MRHRCLDDQVYPDTDMVSCNGGQSLPSPQWATLLQHWWWLHNQFSQCQSPKFDSSAHQQRPAAFSSLVLVHRGDDNINRVGERIFGNLKDLWIYGYI